MTFEKGVPKEAHLSLAEGLVAKARLVASLVSARRNGDGEAADDFPSEDIALLHRHDLLSAPLPARFGGVGLGSDARTTNVLCRILTIIGRGSLPLGRLYEGHVNAIALVTRYGSSMHQKLLADEAAAGRISAVWMAGEALRLVEDRDDRWSIKGQKILCSGAGHVQRPLVAAELPERGSVMLLPKIECGTRADAHAWTPTGMGATVTGDVDFSGVRVGHDEILGQPGDYLRSPYFQGGAWRVIAVQFGGVESIMQHYTEQLAAHPHREHPLQLARYGEALIAAETARHWVFEACRIAESPYDDADEVDAYVNLARNAFEGAALAVIAAAQKAIGLKAFLRPNPLERDIRDLSTYLRQPALDPSLLSAAQFHLERASTRAKDV
jgi:alkylation response protein AidB-like acyl-CoA dehydrogenase